MRLRMLRFRFEIALICRMRMARMVRTSVRRIVTGSVGKEIKDKTRIVREICLHFYGEKYLERYRRRKKSADNRLSSA